MLAMDCAFIIFVMQGVIGKVLGAEACNASKLQKAIIFCNKYFLQFDAY